MTQPIQQATRQGPWTRWALYATGYESEADYGPSEIFPTRAEARRFLDDSGRSHRKWKVIKVLLIDMKVKP